MTKYNLFLDDIRHPYSCLKYVRDVPLEIYSKHDWMIVRNYDEFVEAITFHGLPTLISFDHDLGEAHYAIDFQDWNDYSSNDLGVVETGLDAAKWLINYCMDHKLALPECYVHSMNPVGRENIRKLLENFKSRNL
jgi:hypothetical protein